MASTTTTTTKPLFTITPASSVSSVCVVEGPPPSTTNRGTSSPSEVSIGMAYSDSNTRLMPATPTDDVSSQDSRETLLSGERKETGLSIFLQVFPPFLIAGLGMVFAGLLLDIVKDWRVFREVPEFLILVTPLLGLKGNLEMTLASRLSTQANLGNLDGDNRRWTICWANLSLIQVQGVVVGFLSSIVAIIIGVVLPGESRAFNIRHALVLCASSILTAAIASFVLGCLMIFVIFLSRRIHVNPDNVATPIAASLGDITTLGLLAYIARFLYSGTEPSWIPIAVMAFYGLTLPIWVYVAYRNDCTKNVLINGWTPVICAMFISSMGGLILDKAEQRFAPLALYQPVINGVGGNLVSVQASRISTRLHRDCAKGQLPQGLVTSWGSPFDVYLKRGIDSTAARGMVIPGHIFFLTITHFISTDSQDSFGFVIFYLTAAMIQVGMLLYTADILIRWLWMRNIDPDTSAIPYLTGLGDLLGSALLFLAFAAASFT
ncbi:hypothetical protein Fcan01_12664 [Folsomia candida]|uniref:SLC41A/MgtE integral membrane domain-containing protein n=1 Tax=Folsomia candida TaxID=158441 RepID=A0A226E7L5_FOLCA|nr:hypothetical protein Fcan01_12664 [Folsomia candida]